MLSNTPGYTGKVLRVDLSNGTFKSEDSPSEKVLRQYLGGTGLGIKVLYDEVPPGVEAYDPENRIVFASGPLGGTIGGTGSISVVTKGPMTNGILSSQANGYMGAFLKTAGFDAIIIQGACAKAVYLYIHNGQAELRDAGYLKDRDTWETEEKIGSELSLKPTQLSVFCVGPAGEHRVRFAAVVGDRGHVVAHGGPGAVMASKNLKAIAVARGDQAVPVHDRNKLSETSKVMFEEAAKFPLDFVRWGTSLSYPILQVKRSLPVKNYLEHSFPAAALEEFNGPKYRSHLDRKRIPCWGCRFDHCSVVTIKDGPYAGFVGEEPEYEGFAAWGSLIDQRDPMAALVLSNEVDRLGMDTNEAGWLIAWVMECYEKGLLTTKDTDGLEMTWGNVEATRAMLRKIAFREGIGDLLAEGVMRAAERMGGEARDLAIYTRKGNTPRGHDHRRGWTMILDVSTSSMGVDETGAQNVAPASVGLPPETDPYTPEGAALLLAGSSGKFQFYDSLVICRLTLYGTANSRVIDALNALTGWDFTEEESVHFGRRSVHLARAFNVRHGLTPQFEAPSARYASAALEGPGQGKTMLPVFEEARKNYYRAMGWDVATGWPLPETLKKYDLEFVTR